MNNHLLKLSQRLGYQFQDTSLINLALTHRSKSGKNNERLEFLGDSILNFTIAEVLYHKFNNEQEGVLSRLRANLVKGDTLAEIAKDFELGDFLILGTGELKSGGHKRESILADAVEAIIGAIYLDSGMAECQRCIKDWYQSRINELSLDGPLKDAKSRLQEHQQANKLSLPKYELVDMQETKTAQVATVHCSIPQIETPVIGQSSNRRLAEQVAAEEALNMLGLRGRGK